SWRKLVQVKSLKRTLIFWISSGLAFGLLMGMAIVGGLGSSGIDATTAFRVVLVLALVVVTIIMLAGGWTSGVSTMLQNERGLALPNQGIRLSIRNSVRIGIISGFIGGGISIGALFLLLMLIHARFTASLASILCFVFFCGVVGGTISSLIVG